MKKLGVLMRYKLHTIATAFATTVLAGCVSTSQVLDMGRDTYSVSATADGFRSAASARESAFEAGKAMCTKQGKQFLFLRESSSRTRMGIDTTIDVTFRCLRENDPEYVRPNIKKAPDIAPVKVYQSATVLPPEINIPISRIAVIPFGPPSILTLVEPAVQQNVFNLKKLYKRMRIIDRAEIRHILEEQILQTGGLVDSSTAAKLGKMVGAQVILTYQIQTTPDSELELIQARGGTVSSSISAKLILVETGEVLFQTTSFDHRQIDLPQKHGRDQWSEVKMWRIQSIENAGEQAMADFEAALLWGKIGWYVTDMPPGRIGAYVRRVHPGGLASLARIQPQDVIFKIEAPELPKSAIPKIGFWLIENKERLLDVLSLPTNSFVFILNRRGKAEKVNFWFTPDESKARPCSIWRRNPEKYGLDMRLFQTVLCNTNYKNEAQRDEATKTLNYILSRLKTPSLAPWKEELILSLEDLYSQDPRVFLGMDTEQQFQNLLEHTNARLKAEGHSRLIKP